MVKSNKIIAPQVYLEKILGRFFFLRSNNPHDELLRILGMNDIDVWDYPLSEIDHIVENELDVVLVDLSHYENDIFINEYRWFEVPDGVTI